MVNEYSMQEILMGKEGEGGDGIELSLELSIGGNYGKSSSPEEEKTGDFQNDCARFDFSAQNDDNGCCGGFVDLQQNKKKKREIQAFFRRQEARKKREEKLLQKSRGGVINNNNNVVVKEDKMILEAQKFQNRVQDRGIKENNNRVSQDLCRKLNGVKEEDLNLSLFTSDKKQIIPSMGNGFGYIPTYNVCYMNGNGNGNVSTGGVSTTSLEYCDYSSGFSNNNNGKNVSLERTSSVASDYQGTSLHKGEINSDAGSHSSISHLHKNSNAPRTSKAFELLEGNESSSQTETVPSSTAPQGSNPIKFIEKPKPDPTCSTSENRISPPTKETSGRLTERPPKPPNRNDHATSLPQMPCVSATGNGPNGKTITGFLYKYTKSEVSILCACHGSSFSPAGFVEHAGCVNVSHPLRHITIVPSTLTYRIH